MEDMTGDNEDARTPREPRIDAPELVREIPTFNPLIFRSTWPILAFWVVRSLVSTQAGIIAGFATAVWVFIAHRRQSGMVGLLAILGIVIIGGASIVGLILDSDKAFLASDAARDFMTAAFSLVSVVAGRPLVGIVAREASPRLATQLPENHRVFVQVTVGFAIVNIVTGVMRVFMLEAFDVTPYIILSRVATFPINMAFFTAGYFLIMRTARRASAISGA
jgi:hypothetical protein